MIGKLLENIRKKSQVVHCITNYVTADYCANALHAAGASPVMADCVCEVTDIVKYASALVINMGTVSLQRLRAIKATVRQANKLCIPVIFDPVGVAVSDFRLRNAIKLLNKEKVSVIRGNASEIKALAENKCCSKSLEVDADYEINDKTVCNIAAMAHKLSRKTGAVIVVSGKIDVIVYGDKMCAVKNGHNLMSKVTGCGCVLSSIIGAFVGANSDNIFHSCIAAVSTMGVCAELAAEKLKPEEGTITFKNYIIDALFHISADRLEGKADYEIKKI